MLEQLNERTSPLGDAISVKNERVTVLREADLASPKMDALVREAVFGTGESRDYARWLIWEIGEAVGVRAASINGLQAGSFQLELRGVEPLKANGQTTTTTAQPTKTPKPDKTKP